MTLERAMRLFSLTELQSLVPHAFSLRYCINLHALDTRRVRLIESLNAADFTGTCAGNVRLRNRDACRKLDEIEGESYSLFEARTVILLAFQAQKTDHPVPADPTLRKTDHPKTLQEAAAASAVSGTTLDPV